MRIKIIVIKKNKSIFKSFEKMLVKRSKYPIFFNFRFSKDWNIVSLIKLSFSVFTLLNFGILVINLNPLQSAFPNNISAFL